MAIDAAEWAAIGSIGSVGAAFAAVFVAWRVGRMTVDITSQELLSRSVDRFNSSEIRGYRRTVAKAHLAGSPIDTDDLRAILNIFEFLGESVRAKTLRLHFLWSSELGDLIVAYVLVGDSAIASLQQSSPTYFDASIWLRKRLLRHTFVREGHDRLSRGFRRSTFWKTARYDEEQLHTILRIEEDLQLPVHF